MYSNVSLMKQEYGFAQMVRSTGGNVFSPPEEIQGWMYGFGFAHPNRHRWDLVYVDWGDDQ